MSTLREALEALLEDYDELTEDWKGLAGQDLRELLAAHPAEVPSESVEIPDAAVEAAAKAVSLDWRNYIDSMRIALVAARPYLMPEVVVDHRPGETCSVAAEVDPGTGFARPLLDRDKVSRVLVSFALGGREGAASPHELLGMAVHAIEGLARPMPTREQIEQHIRRVYIDGGAHITVAQEAAADIATEMLALLNGEIKKGEDR